MSAYKTRYWAVPGTLFLLICQLGFCWRSLAHSLGGDVDFRVFYSSGHMAANGLGDSLYDYDVQRKTQGELANQSGETLPFLYPAFAALLFLPFSFLPYKVAFLLFASANLCLLGITGMWMQSYLPLLQKSPPWLPGYLFLSFFPVSIAIMQGQLSCIMLFFYTLSFVQYKNDHDLSSGLFLAATLIKFQLTLPVVFLLLCWRRWRTVAGFALGAMTLTATSVIISGPHEAMQYIHSLLNITREGMQNAQAARLRYGMFPGDMPNFRGFFFLIMQGSRIGQAIALLCSAGLMTWAARQRPSFAIALPTAMMVSYHMQAYDLTLLLLPLAIEIDCLWTERTFIAEHVQLRKGLVGASRALALSLALLLVPIAPFILIKGMCGLFAIPIIGILWAATCHQTAPRDHTSTQPSEITAPQPG